MMMRGVAVVAVLAIAAFVARADVPEFPWQSICSMQGGGRMAYRTKDPYFGITGTFDMKRANWTALFSFMYPVRSEYGGDLLIRPDLNKLFFAYRGLGYDADVFLDNPPLPSMFTYAGIRDCGREEGDNSRCHTFVITEPLYNTELCRMSFYENDMRLEHEYYFFQETNTSIRFNYTNIDTYEHTQIDDEFSLTRWGDNFPAATQAAWALSSGCNKLPEPAPPAPGLDFPVDKICSMQGGGWIAYMTDYPHEGAFDMWRANFTALFEFSYPVKREYGGDMLIRPDLNQAYFAYRGLGRDVDVVMPNAPMPSMFTYMGVRSCRTDKQCHQFSIVDPFNATEYSTFSFYAEDMSLESEYYYFPKPNTSMKFIYEYVNEYYHGEVDDKFSVTRYGEQSPAATPAIYALSSGCGIAPPSSEPSEPSEPSSQPASPSPEPSSQPASPSPEPSSQPTSPSPEPSSQPASPSPEPSSGVSSAPASVPSSTPTGPSQFVEGPSLAVVDVPSLLLVALVAIVVSLF